MLKLVPSSFFGSPMHASVIDFEKIFSQFLGFQVDITNRSLNVDLTNYVESGEFDLIRVFQRRRVVKYTCCPEPYPDLTFYIHIRRKVIFGGIFPNFQIFTILFQILKLESSVIAKIDLSASICMKLDYRISNSKDAIKVRPVLYVLNQRSSWFAAVLCSKIGKFLTSIKS